MRWLYVRAVIENWLMVVDLLGRHAGIWRYIQGSTRNCENEGKTVNLRWMLYSVCAVLGVCCTLCMLYSVYAVLSVCCTQCLLMIMAWWDEGYWLTFTFCDDSREREMEDEDENDMEDRSGCEKSGVRHAWFGLEDHVSVFSPTRLGVVPAISGMLPWLALDILSSVSFSWWFPSSPLISLFLYHHLKTQS